MLARRLLLVALGGSFTGPFLMGAMEYAKVRRATGAQTVVHNTNTVMTFDVALHDPEGYWDSSSKFIIPAGKGGVPFLLVCGSSSNDMPSPDGSITILVNAAQIHGSATTFYQVDEQAPGFGIGQIASGTALEVLDDGDEVQVQVYQDSANNANASMDFAGTTMTLLRLALP